MCTVDGDWREGREKNRGREKARKRREVERARAQRNNETEPIDGT